MLCTPSDVQNALSRARPEWRRQHDLNANHPSVEGCKIGTVFSHEGEYYIYVGVAARNRKFPVIAYRVRDRAFRKMTAPLFDKVRKAS